MGWKAQGGTIADVLDKSSDSEPGALHAHGLTVTVPVGYQERGPIMELIKLRKLIRDVPGFPKPGIVFKDMTPLLRDAAALSLTIEYMAQPFLKAEVDVVTGAESRGFIFASAVARTLSAGFVPIRKPGRLPAEVASKEYQLEYGSDRLEIHVDSINKNDRVLLVDDLLATGGTMAACVDLVRSLGGIVVGAVFLIELDELCGREKIGDVPIHTLLHS